MIRDLRVPFADTGADQLRFSRETADLPGLATVERAGFVPGGHLSLRLLGASHQARLSTADGCYRETVACLPGVGDPVPERAESRLGPWRIGFRGARAVLDPAGYGRRCAALRAAAVDRTDTVLLGRFPGSVDAITFLDVDPQIEPGAPHWHTVHCYPESLTIVDTVTVLTPVT